jgi:hypothetical protein
MKHLPLFIVAVLVLVFSTTGQAHHSIAATYRLSDTQSISGTIVQVALREPHSFLHVEAPDSDGIVRRWSAEWDAGTPVLGRSNDHNPLRVGNRVRIVGHPGQNPEVYRLLIVEITRLANSDTT